MEDHLYNISFSANRQRLRYPELYKQFDKLVQQKKMLDKRKQYVKSKNKRRTKYFKPMPIYFGECIDPITGDKVDMVLNRTVGTEGTITTAKWNTDSGTFTITEHADK